MTYTEAPMSVSMKPHAGFDAPLLTIRADNPQELVERLTFIEQNGTLDAVGRLQAAYAAAYQLGSQLGARTENDPSAGAPAPAAPPEPQGWGGAAPAEAPPAYAAPAPAYAPPAPAAAQAPAGAPMILGMPAIYKEGQRKDGSTWRAWTDPRPYQQVKAFKDNKVDNPNDPGLAAGTAVFWAWIK